MGLVGSGGFLTVPILVYLIGIPPVLATAYSLFTLSLVSSIGSVLNYRRNLVNLRIAFIFGIPSLITVYLTRRFLIPNIPSTLFVFGELDISKNMGIMVLFAVMMLAAGLSMLKKRTVIQTCVPNHHAHYNYGLISFQGILVGFLSSLVGTGGGFLIIPTLTVSLKLPMKLAVGTSLSIIAMKSSIGFIGDVQAGQMIDWTFLLLFSGLASIGIFIGLYLSKFLSNQKLKQGFAWFVATIALVIILKELIII